MLESGLIRPSCSPFASPVVLVKKPDNSLRVCIDYQTLNERTVPDSYPLPRVDESWEFLSGAKYLSTLDLYSGFHQVNLDEDSKQYTAFITSRGLYEYNRMPQGARNPPGAFARLMQFVLSGLLFHSAVIYLDDCLIASKTFEEHLKHLEEVFKRLEHYNLKLKLKKCCFARKSLPFLGYLITCDGVCPDNNNINQLLNCPVPQSVTAVRSFLGLANYYRRFCKGYAQLAKPLVDLTKKGSRFSWTKECERAFEGIISALTRAPTLVYPKFDQVFKLSTDASDTGCGAVLSQEHKGRDHPIAYFSKCFTGAMLRYSVVEKEFYAIVLSLRHWKHFVWGHTVYVYSDRQSISWGIKQTDSPRLMKWVALLSDFDLKFFYRPGSCNGPADFLSRMWKEHSVDCVTIKQPTEKPALSLPREERVRIFKEAQRNDDFLSKVIDFLQGKPVDDSQVTQVAKRCVFCEFSGCLYNFSDLTGKLVVPSSMRPGILYEAHDSVSGGHQGIFRTLQKILQKFWWPGVHADVSQYVHSCAGYAAKKNPTHPIRKPLRPVVASAPWNSVVIDILGPFPTSSKQNKYLLVCMDRFTKWPECCPLRNIRADSVARAFVALVVTRHGVPMECQSDQGTQFTSTMFREVGRLLGMKHTYSAAYHPEAQGLVERFNSTLCALLRAFVAKNQKDWCQYLDLVLFAYRTSTHSSTGFSPFELECGRSARLPMHDVCPPADDKHYDSACEYIDKLRTGLQLAFAKASRANTVAASGQKARYDQKARMVEFQEGDLVFIRQVEPSEGLTPKLHPSWMGPCLVCAILGDELLVKPEDQRIKARWVHINDCKPFTRRRVNDALWPEPANDKQAVEERSSPVVSDAVTDASTQDVKQDENLGSESDASVADDDDNPSRYGLRPLGFVDYRD